MLTNGPGDPQDNPKAIAAIRELMGKKPVFGICLGHQLMALAMGGRTVQMKYGHHGANHPVKDLARGHVLCHGAETTASWSIRSACRRARSSAT